MSTPQGTPRRIGLPRRSAEEQVFKVQAPLPNQIFQPLPAPTGSAPYRLNLSEVLGEQAVTAITAKGSMTFHCVGDTGGIMDPHPQESVIEAMIADLSTDPRPSFFYHLGDVVYFNGQKDQYYPQFYEPYRDYVLPIVAIPGNHDGDAVNAAVEPSLAAFVENFCATGPVLTPEAQDAHRDAMTQPNVYWTLNTPLVTVVGLYSNCPDGGVIKLDQVAWLEEELAAADKNLPVIVTLHHPIYSADSIHGGNANLGALLDGAAAKANRVPDLVLTAHVHNYQRFTRNWQGRQIPYIVAGAGGYHNLHKVAMTMGGHAPALPWQLPAPYTDTELVAYTDDKFGFMRITIATGSIAVTYLALKPVAVVGDPVSAHIVDSFKIDVVAHKVG